MDDKEASPTSNSTSPPNKKNIVLGVVNASEIKCKVDRKRRWDQPPTEGESEGPPFKQMCDIIVEDFVEDKPLENNFRHTDNFENNDTLEDIPLPPSAGSSGDRLTAPPSPSEPLVIKEQIVVQTPSDVLNSLDINSSFPISSSFNDLNYTEGNQRVTIEIETVEVTPSASDDEPKTSIQIIDPNSATVDSLSKNDNGLAKMAETNCNDESISGAPSPLDSEGGDVVDRASIDVESAGNVDPAVMEVILGISPSKDSPQQALPSQEYTVNTSPRVDNDDENLNKNLSSVEQTASLGELKLRHENQVVSDKSICNKGSDISRIIGVKLKGLVDYDDDSDESSQLSDKTIPAEAVKRKPAEEMSTVCENSVDSKEEEFHDCVEHQTTDESNHDSTSLNLPVVSAQDSDDLINNNPLETDNGNYNEVEDNSNSKNLEIDSMTNIAGESGLSTIPESDLSNNSDILKEIQLISDPLNDLCRIDDKIMVDKEKDSSVTKKCNSLEGLNSEPTTSETADVEKLSECISLSNNDLNLNKTSENVEIHQPFSKSGNSAENNNEFIYNKPDSDLPSENVLPESISGKSNLNNSDLTCSEQKCEEPCETADDTSCEVEKEEDPTDFPVLTSQNQDSNDAIISEDTIGSSELQELKEIERLTPSNEKRVQEEPHILELCDTKDVNAELVTSSENIQECLHLDEKETTAMEVPSSSDLGSVDDTFERFSCSDDAKRDQEKISVNEIEQHQEDKHSLSICESGSKERDEECGDLKTEEENDDHSVTVAAEINENKPLICDSELTVERVEDSSYCCDKGTNKDNKDSLSTDSEEKAKPLSTDNTSVISGNNKGDFNGKHKEDLSNVTQEDSNEGKKKEISDIIKDEHSVKTKEELKDKSIGELSDKNKEELREKSQEELNIDINKVKIIDKNKEDLLNENTEEVSNKDKEEKITVISDVEANNPQENCDLFKTSDEDVKESLLNIKNSPSVAKEIQDPQEKKLDINISDSSIRATEVVLNAVEFGKMKNTLIVDSIKLDETDINIVKGPDNTDEPLIAEKNDYKESLKSTEVESSKPTEEDVIVKIETEITLNVNSLLPERNNLSLQQDSNDQDLSKNILFKNKEEEICKDKLICSENEVESNASKEVILKSNTSIDNVKIGEKETSVCKTDMKDFVQSPQIVASENSLHSSVDLNMECESVDTEQSIESINESLSVFTKEEPPLLLNSNAVIDISSDSTSSDKKDKTCLSFNLSSINKKASENVKQLDDKNCTVISSDDDTSSIKYLSASKKTTVDSMKKKCEVNATSVVMDKNKLGADISGHMNSDVILVPDSDSSNSKSEFISKGGPSNKVPENTVSLTVSSNSVADPKLSSNNDGSSGKRSFPKNKSSSDSIEVCNDSTELQMINEETLGECGIKDEGELTKVEPITLRIFKDNNSLHSESGGGGSPKRPRLDDSPKQLEFTLKISKDASTNIPKATMSPKRTQSPQRPLDPISRISSEVSITPIVFPPQSDKKTVKKGTRHGQSVVNDASGIELSVDTKPKPASENADVRVPSVDSLINNIPCGKTDLSNFNSVRVSASGEESSIIEIKDEAPMGSPVNISVRGGIRGRSVEGRGGMPISMPKRRGRPPKRPMEAMLSHAMMGMMNTGTPGILSTSGIRHDISGADAPSGRPVRECRDRTRPIIFRQRRPRGGGNPRGRGGGRGGVRIPLIPGREALSLKEQEELARIEARNQQIRLEKLAKREAKLAKKAKRAPSPGEVSPPRPPPPPPPPVELTEEEKAEIAARKEAAAKARAEAAAAAAAEAERLAQEAAAAKEAEKLAKIMARRERLRELHRMKREKILAKKAAKKIKDEERRKRKAAEKAAEQAAALQSMYEDETRMSAPDGSLRPLYAGEDSSNRNKTGRMEINLSESKEVSVDQLAEYQWEGGDLYMIQEQVAEYLGVKSFKRKYPDLRRRAVDAEERKYLEETGLVPKSLCDLGITAVSSSEVLDVMYQDFPDKYEEVRKYLREKQMREISSKQKALSLYSKQSDKAKADLRDQAMESSASWNAHLNKERREERKSSMDLQSFVIHYPLSKREVMKHPTSGPGTFPVAVLPGQYCDYYKRYTSNELMYYPLNTVLYGPLKPNERHILQSDASLSESESSSSEESSSSSDESDSESEGDEDAKCKVCNSSRSSGLVEGSTPSRQPMLPNGPEIFLPCSNCKLLSHPSCCKITAAMLSHVRKYNWLCTTCKVCVKCNSSEHRDKMRLCDLCDRGFHLACLDARKLVPEGKRWHCAICSFCWSCGAREPGGPSNQWLHEFIKDENGEKVYQRSLCAACCANVGREAAAAVAATAAAARGNASSSTNIIATTMAGSSGMMASPSTPPTTPVRGYQVIQTKDGNQVRVAMSRGMGPMLVRSPGIMGGPRGATPETLVVRSPRGPETVVIRSPISTPRPRQNIILSPNNRIDMISHLSTININGATNYTKK